ncbi:hypothetical protein DAI22_03g357700 [Oryza sativa Japonica Group]|jgi:hypothetical protein|nr:hypothetical protein DAI22_03g357700 [Oryza sativa Japonica Group]
MTAALAVDTDRRQSQRDSSIHHPPPTSTTPPPPFRRQERERKTKPKKKKAKTKRIAPGNSLPNPIFLLFPPDILIRPPPPPPPPRRRRSPASKRRSHPALVGGTGVCVCDGDGLLPARARRREGLVGRRARPPCLSAWIGIELKMLELELSYRL